MRHKPPQSVIDLHTDEYTAASEGRHALLAWMDNLDLNVGDEIMIPEVGGGFSIWKRTTIPKNKIQQEDLCLI